MSGENMIYMHKQMISFVNYCPKEVRFKLPKALERQDRLYRDVKELRRHDYKELQEQVSFVVDEETGIAKKMLEDEFWSYVFDGKWNKQIRVCSGQLLDTIQRILHELQDENALNVHKVTHFEHVPREKTYSAYLNKNQNANAMTSLQFPFPVALNPVIQEKMKVKKKTHFNPNVEIQEYPGSQPISKMKDKKTVRINTIPDTEIPVEVDAYPEQQTHPLKRPNIKKPAEEKEKENLLSVIMIPIKAKITYFMPGFNYVPSIEAIDAERNGSKKPQHKSSKGNSRKSSSGNTSRSTKASTRYSLDSIIKRDPHTSSWPLSEPDNNQLFTSTKGGQFITDTFVQRQPSPAHANYTDSTFNMLTSKARKAHIGVQQTFQHHTLAENLDSIMESTAYFAGSTGMQQRHSAVTVTGALTPEANWPYGQKFLQAGKEIIAGSNEYLGINEDDPSFEMLAPRKKPQANRYMPKTVESIHDRVRAGLLSDPEEYVFPADVPFSHCTENRGEQSKKKHPTATFLPHQRPIFTYHQQEYKALRPPLPKKIRQQKRYHRPDIKYQVYDLPNAGFDTGKLTKNYSISNFRRNKKYEHLRNEIMHNYSQDHMDNIRHKLERHSEETLLPRIASRMLRTPRNYKIQPKPYNNREPSVPKLKGQPPEIFNTFLMPDYDQFRYDLLKACAMYIVRKEQITVANGRKDWQTVTSVVINKCL